MKHRGRDESPSTDRLREGNLLEIWREVRPPQARAQAKQDMTMTTTFKLPMPTADADGPMVHVPPP
jgi:hypothetical protein